MIQNADVIICPKHLGSVLQYSPEKARFFISLDLMKFLNKIEVFAETHSWLRLCGGSRAVYNPATTKKLIVKNRYNGIKLLSYMYVEAK